MSENIEIQTTSKDITLQTKGKYVDKDIHVLFNVPVAKEEEEISITPTTSNQEILPTEGKVINKVNVNAVTSTIDSNILPENIALGKTILGVEGKVSSLKKLLDATKRTSSLFQGFQGASIDDLIQYDDTENVNITSNMFYYCSNLVTIKSFNTKKVYNMGNMFGSCISLKRNPQIDTSNVGDMNSLFNNCTSLIDVVSINMISANNTDNMFLKCVNLTNLELFNIKVNLKIGSGTEWGHLLTLDSLINTIKELVNVGSAITLTMGSANLEKITDVYVKRTTDGDIPVCLSDNSNIDLAKAPCEVCASTDEGAMTITAYANLKGWTLA